MNQVKGWAPAARYRRGLGAMVLALGMLALAGCGGSSSSTPAGTGGIVGGKAYFRADNGTNGNELWVTDGTIAGTHMVKDINPAGDSFPDTFTAFAGFTYFRADSDGDGISELWRTDGTANGTTQVQDIAGHALTLATQLTVVGNLLYFLSDSDFIPGSLYDFELWRTDGTAAGTIDVSSFSAFSDGSTFDAIQITDVGGKAFMAGSLNGLPPWHLVATTGGASTLDEVRNSGGTAVVNPQELVAFNSALYFAADDGSNFNWELWRSDGTAANTKLLQEINTGGGSFPESFRVLGSELLFVAEDGSTGRELFKTDGTPTGAAVVKDIYPGFTGSGPIMLTLANGLLFFRAGDSAATDLWKSDGTSAGTVALPVPSPSQFGSFPQEVKADGARVFFLGSDSTGQRLFVTDGGTPAALGPVIAGCSSILGSGLGYVAVGLESAAAIGFELWLTDGTPAHTFRVPGVTPYVPCG